jgi:hypothetical protein
MSGIRRQSSTQEGRQCAEDQEKCINWHTVVSLHPAANYHKLIRPVLAGTKRP